MSNNSKDSTARRIAFASLGIAILSLGFSYYQYHEDNKEKFNVVINRVKVDYKTKIESRNNVDYLLTWWDCLLINNNGKKNLAVDKYELTSDTIYAHLNWCICKNYLDMSIIQNPSGSFTRNIDPNNAETIYLGVGIKLSKAACEIIKKNKMNFDSLSMRKIEKSLIDNNIDMYGQPLHFKFTTTQNSTAFSSNVWKPYYSD